MADPNERWPRKGDRIFVPGDDAWPANSVGEREYRIAEGYKMAGDMLIENFLGNARDYDNLLYPILFCYRHFVEIRLKQIIDKHGPWTDVTLADKDRNHKLPNLWKLFVQIASVYGNDPESEAVLAIKSMIDELEIFDARAEAFRYAKDKKGELIPLEFSTIDIANVREVMNGIANFLECAQLDFDHKRDINQSTRRDLP